ncbi:MAG: hypothetical protein AAF647_02435 [Pseudomonadota bacterium]
MDPDDASSRLASLSAEIALKYGVSGSFERQVRKLGRALPRYERVQARELVRAERALGHAKLQKQVDRQVFERAETALLMHLEGVDASHRRRGYLLDVTTTTVLVNVLLAGGVLVFILTFLGPE